jgi:hypothetical protein
MGAGGSSWQTKSDVIKVAMVGLTESGKSHYLSEMTEMYYTVVGPTNGVETTLVSDRRWSFAFMEYGFYAMNRLLDNDNWWRNPLHVKCDCVMLFIDVNDTHSDVRTLSSDFFFLLELFFFSFSQVMLARNLATRFAAFQNKPGQPSRIPLVVIHNNGRPRKQRRNIVKVTHSQITRLSWDDETQKTEEPSEPPLIWEYLERVIDVPYLTQHFFSSVNLAQVSTSHNIEARDILFDWIARNVKK